MAVGQKSQSMVYYTSTHHYSYYVLEKADPNELTGFNDGCRDESLRIYCNGSLSALRKNEKFSNIKEIIINDIKTLQSLSFLAESNIITPQEIHTRLSTFTDNLFEISGRSELSSEIAINFRKTFFSQVIVDFHKLVGLLSSAANNDQDSSLNIKEVYFSLISKIHFCIGYIQTVTLDGLNEMISPSFGHAQSTVTLASGNSSSVADRKALDISHTTSSTLSALP